MRRACCLALAAALAAVHGDGSYKHGDDVVLYANKVGARPRSYRAARCLAAARAAAGHCSRMVAVSAAGTGRARERTRRARAQSLHPAEHEPRASIPAPPCPLLPMFAPPPSK